MDAVLNWLWQGSVVAVALAVMLRLMARARAQTRYAVCWAALLFVIALPVLPFVGRAATAQVAMTTAASEAAVDTILLVPHSWWTSAVVIVLLWLSWSAVQLGRLVPALLTLHRIRRHSRGFPPTVERRLSYWMSIRRRGRRTSLVVSDRIRAAAVLAWGSPLIAVAPALIDQLDADELDRVLVHEWAHVQRRDDRANLWQLVIRVLAGWHPAVWWIDRRLQIEREIACDEMTVAVTGSPKSYAACLVKLAGLPLAGWQSATAPAASARLGPRIVRLVSHRPLVSLAWSRGAGAAVAALLCAVALSIAGVRIIAIAAEPSGDAVNTVARADVSTAPRPQPPIAAARRATVGQTELRQARATTPAAPQSPIAAARAEPLPTPSDTAPPAGEREISPGAVTAVQSEATDAAAMTPLEARLMDAAVALSPGPRMARPTVDAPPGQSPWDAAAGAGAAIGRGSQTAGVATAGFFSRFAKRVARSF